MRNIIPQNLPERTYPACFGCGGRFDEPTPEPLCAGCSTLNPTVRPTRGQHRLLALLASGARHAEIAKVWPTSIHTIKMYASDLLCRTGSKTTPNAVAKWLRSGCLAAENWKS